MKTKNWMKFIDDKASEGYSSEEDENLEIERDFNRKEAEKLHTLYMANREKREQALRDRLKQIVENQNAQEVDADETEEYVEDLDDLPKLNDPKLFCLTCKKGTEFELFQRLVDIIQNGSYQLCSLFINPKIRGSIFFESFYEQNIYQVLMQIKYGTLTYVEPEHCLELLEVQQHMNLELGQWVRIKKHRKYEGDLGRIMKINKISNRITIKVIARNELNQKVPITCRILLQQQEIEEGYNTTLQQSSFVYNSFDIERKVAKLDGFELITVKIISIEPNIQINEDELQMFFPDIKDRKYLVQQAKKELIMRVDVNFKVGQRVRLINDTDGSPEFTINKIYEDQMLELNLKQKGAEFTYLVHASEVKIALKKYQQVKVVDGPHKGDFGVIITIKPNYVVIVTEFTSYKVPHSCLEQGNYQNYSTQFDLVKYGQSELDIGCVLKQKSNSAIILNLQNQQVEINQQFLTIIPYNQIQINSNNQQFQKNDSVLILSGLYSNKNGLIKQGYNGKLFIFNQIFPNLVILEDTNNCRLLISNTLYNKNPELKKIIGSNGKIKTGQWRGYRGRVVKTTHNNLLTVQLECRNQLIQIGMNDFEQF